MTSAEDLIKFAKQNLGNRDFIAAIQREPFMHVRKEDGTVEAQKTIGGVTVLLNGILQKTGGLVVATGSGDVDKNVVDSRGRVKVPPGEESYTLKRIFLSEKDLDGWYYGFANQTLWPMCHNVFVKPIFHQSWWQSYVRVNQQFADAILAELNGRDAFVWVNDYHFALLPRMLREKKPNLSIGIFWHIPWPTMELFRICPWRHQILEGMLGADLVGFHRQYHVENFTDCLREEIGVIVESEPRSVLYRKRLTKVTHLPSGIDIEEIDQKIKDNDSFDRSIFEKDLGIKIDAKFLIISVDRIDYTKGLLERFRIIDRLLEKYPTYIGKIACLSIGVPSRTPIPAYRTYNTKVKKLVDRINEKYRKDNWQPIHFYVAEKGIDRNRLFMYYRLADIGLITPLDDGMNLIAKEFVVSAKPDKGMLVLSRFAGAAKDLHTAMLINPYDTDGSADALQYALDMKPEERVLRNTKMREALEENNIYHWGIEFMRNTTTENLTQKYL